MTENDGVTKVDFGQRGANPPPPSNGGGGGSDGDILRRISSLEGEVQALRGEIKDVPSDVNSLKSKVLGWNGLDGRMWGLIVMGIAVTAFTFLWFDGKFQYVNEKFDINSERFGNMIDTVHDAELRMVESITETRELRNDLEGMSMILQSMSESIRRIELKADE